MGNVARRVVYVPYDPDRIHGVCDVFVCLQCCCGIQVVGSMLMSTNTNNPRLPIDGSKQTVAPRRCENSDRGFASLLRGWTIPGLRRTTAFWFIQTSLFCRGPCHRSMPALVDEYNTQSPTREWSDAPMDGLAERGSAFFLRLLGNGSPARLRLFEKNWKKGKK